MALMVQVPARRKVTVVPETAHSFVVADVKVTLKALDAVAERETVPVPSVLGERAPKVML